MGILYKCVNTKMNTVGETGAPWTPIFHFGFASNICVAH